MNTLYVLAAALLGSIPAVSSQANSPVAASAFAPVFTEYLSARDALLRDSNADLPAYKELVNQHAARVDLASLSLDELAQGAFAGLFDFLPSRTAAAQRCDALQAADPTASARVATLRLRLLGNRTIESDPDAEMQEALVSRLLADPQLPSLMASPAAREVIDALVGVGRSPILRKHTAAIVSLVEQLDPKKAPEVAADLSQAALLLVMALPDWPTERKQLGRLIEYGKAVLKEDLPEAARRATEREVARLEQTLRVPTEADAPALSRRAEKEARETQGLGSVGVGYTGVLEDFGNYLLGAIEGSARLGGRAMVRFNTELPRAETVFEVPDSWHQVPGKAPVRAADAVTVLGGQPTRAFGGVRVQDPAIRVRATDFGLDRDRQSGFVEMATIRGDLFRVSADRIAVAGPEMQLDKARLNMVLLGLPLVGVDADRLQIDRDRRLRLEKAGVRLLGFRVYAIDSLTTAPGSKSSEAAGAEKSQPDAKGQSPLYKWLKLPSLSIFDGGFTLTYNNALKFAGRWTGITSFRLSTSIDPSLTLAANYNLLGVNNEVDRFIDSPSLQNKFLGSYYYTIRNQEHFMENDRLLRPFLIAGASTQWNVSYEDAAGDRNEADVPLSVGFSGGGPIGGFLGARGQISYEQVQDKGHGEDTRFALTGVVGPRPFRIARGIHMALRAEGTSRFGSGDPYTWYRGNAGVTFLPIPKLRISGSYYRAWEEGTARFPYDRVVEDRGYTARFDLQLGLTKLGYMNQYSDVDNHWVRHQFYISRQVGIIEPFISYDEQFSTVSFGFNFNVSAPFESVRRRTITGFEPSSR
jgi:hypothetical protein